LQIVKTAPTTPLPFKLFTISY